MLQLNLSTANTDRHIHVLEPCAPSRAPPTRLPTHSLPARLLQTQREPCGCRPAGLPACMRDRRRDRCTGGVALETERVNMADAQRDGSKCWCNLPRSRPLRPAVCTSFIFNEVSLRCELRANECPADQTVRQQLLPCTGLPSLSVRLVTCGYLLLCWPLRSCLQR